MGKEEKYPVETYSRIVGYISPLKEWNKGKLEEYEDRKTYEGVSDNGNRSQ